MNTFTLRTGTGDSTFTKSFWNFSDFQHTFLEWVATRQTFKHFVFFNPSTEQNGPARKRGPVVFMWYETDGKVHAQRVGVKDIIDDEVVSDVR